MKRFGTTNRQRYRRPGHRTIAGVAAVAALGLAAAACSSSGSSGASGDGHVTISVNCEPPATATAQRKEWNEDVAAFEKANPNITIKSVTYTGQCEVPAQFTATLKAGTETNLFYAYFTDLHQVLDAGQAADITSYVNSTTVPTLKDIVPSAMAAETAGKTLYGLPTDPQELYRHLVDVSGDGIVEVLEYLARPDALPALVHCHVGKDRTGILVALLLELLGVTREEILPDYVASNAGLGSIAHTQVQAEVLAWTLAGLEERYGSTRGYLEAHGLTEETVTALRAALLEP